MTDHLSCGVLMENTEGMVIYVNPAFCRCFGVERDWCIGRSGEEVIAAIKPLFEQAEDFEQRVKSLRAGRETSELEAMTLMDGRVVEGEFTPLRDGDVKAGKLWHFHDVTARKQTERTLENTQRALRRLVAHAPVVLFELDKDGVLVAVEGREDSLVGLTKEQVIGLSLRELLPHLPFPELQAQFERALAGEEVETQIELNGRVYQVRTAPVPTNTPENPTFLGVALDITERHMAEVALRQSEEKYRAIIENIEDGYYEVDLQGNFTFVNDSLSRIVGYPRERLVAEATRSYKQYLEDASAAVIERAFRQVYETGEPVRAVETKIFRSDGVERFLEISVSLIRAADGTPVGFRGIVRDVTDRKQVENALTQRMNLFGILQQLNINLGQTLDLDIVTSAALNSALVLSDADAGFIGIVQGDELQVVRSTGYLDELTSFHVNEGVVGRAIRTGVGQLVTDVRQDPDYVQELAETEAQITIPLISQDKLIGVLNLETTDRSRFTPEVYEFVELLTARITAAMVNAQLYEVAQQQLGELSKLYAELSQLEQMKTDMIRIAAHDLRSPLGIIAGYLALLKDDLEPYMGEEQLMYVDSINRAVDRISRMSTDILSLERVQAKDKATEHQLIDFTAMVARAVSDQQEAAAQKDQTMTLMLPEAPLMVRRDPTDLLEAIFNLLTNAVKYTPDGGHIEVRIWAEYGLAIFEVEDTGYGIPEEHLPRLFQPFYRAKLRETERIEGTGLGLYLVKKVIEQHGGRIRFRSSYGEGSVFGFELPLAVPEAPETPETPETT